MRNMNTLLRGSQFLQWVRNLIPIPMGILIAQWMSLIVSRAIEGDIAGVLGYGAALLMILILQKGLEVGIGIAYETTSSKALHACKLELYRRYLSQPRHRLFCAGHGDAVEKLNDDFRGITNGMLQTYPAILCGAITAIVYGGFLAWRSTVVAVCLVAMSLLQLIPPFIVKRYIQINYDNCRKIEEEIADFTAEGYRGFATIKLYHLKSWWIDKLKEYHRRYTAIGGRSEATGAVEDMLTLLVDNILRYGAYGMLGLFVLFGYISYEVGVQAISLSAGLFAAVKTATAAMSDIAVAKAAKKRLSAWYTAEQEQKQLPKGHRVVCDAAVVAYGDETAFENITLTVNSDSVCVIKGENGSGKSTLFRLITGLLPCAKGVVTVGGVAPIALDDAIFPRAICYLPQEDAALDITAWELFGMVLGETAPQAVEVALEYGLSRETLETIGIRSLSGGERKKVYLSLAFALKPLLLLLDEPTNSLDTAGQRILRKHVQNRGATVIITHDTIFDDIADEVYRLDKGGIQRETLIKA